MNFPKLIDILYPIEILEMTDVIDNMISKNYITNDDSSIIRQAIIYEKYDIITKLVNKEYDLNRHFCYKAHGIYAFPLYVALKCERIEMCKKSYSRRL